MSGCNGMPWMCVCRSVCGGGIMVSIGSVVCVCS